MQLKFYGVILKKRWQKVGKSSVTLRNANTFDTLGKLQGNNVPFSTLLNIYPDQKSIRQSNPPKSIKENWRFKTIT